MGAPRTGMPDPVLMGGWMNGDGGGDGRCSDVSPSFCDDGTTAAELVTGSAAGSAGCAGLRSCSGGR